MSRDRGKVVRGAALGGLAAFAIALFALVVSGSGDTYRVKATFEDVRGLIPGGEVKAGSETVGSVEDITLGKGELPVVTMKIDDEYALERGAFANVRLASNLGGTNRYIELTRGNGPRLADGATLGPAQTDQPVDLDTAVSDLDPKTRRQVAGLLAGVDRAVKGRGSDLDRTLRHSAYALEETADLLAAVGDDRVALRTLVHHTRRVVRGLAAGQGDLGDSAERLASVLSVTGRRQQELRRSARALAPGLRGARRTLDAVSNGIPALTSVAVVSGPALKELAPTARAVRPAIKALRPLLREAGALIRATPSQVRRIRAVSRAAIPVVRRLQPLLEGAGPLVDYLRAFAPEVLGFFTTWSDASSNYDGAGTLARLGFSPLEGERHPNLVEPFEGPIAGLLRRPFYRTPGSLEGGQAEAWRDYADSFISGGKSVDELSRGAP